MSAQGYILRYYLPAPPHFDRTYTELRFTQLLDFCRKNGVGAVMLYVALDPNWYYMPESVEECRAQRDIMLSYIERLREAGIGYQLNFQNLMGSVPGGADFSEKFGWESLVDQKGRAANGCACPIDPVFRAQSEQRLALWAATKPDVIWIDDDLRLHNHGTPVLAAAEGKGHYSDYYCFCNAHVRAFNERYGTAHTREELIQAMTRAGEPHPLRARYLRFLGDTVTETAAWIRRTVLRESPKTRLAQMTSKPDVHAAEGRDWSAFLAALCGKEAPLIRAHFGPYQEGDPRGFVSCYTILAQTMAQLGTFAQYCPEVENTRFTAWSKSRAATSFQLALSAFMGCRDITLSLYDLDGGALADEPVYGQMLRGEKARLDRILALDLLDAENEGVVIPTAPDSGERYRLREGEGYEQLGGKNRCIETYLLRAGIPCRYLQPERICRERDLAALDAFTAGFLSDDEISALLGGRLLLDGGAASVLLARGFGSEIGVKSMTRQWTVANVEALHTVKRADGTPIRIPLRTPCGAWYSVDSAPAAKRLSTLYDPLGVAFAGLTTFENGRGGRIAVYPLEQNYGDGFFTHHRVTLLKDLIGELAADMPRVDHHAYLLSVVKRSADGARYYFVANLCADETEEIALHGTRVPCRLPLFGTAVFREKNGELTQIV